MTAPGLCHGPGCGRPAVVPFWCSEGCAANWAWLSAHPDPAARELLDRAALAAEADYDRARKEPAEEAMAAAVGLADATVGPVARWLGRMFGKETP